VLDDPILENKDVGDVTYHKNAPTYSSTKHCCMNLIPRLGLMEFTKGSTYRAGLVELVGEIQFVFLSCLIANGVSRTGVPYPVVYSSILHVFLFMFMVSSTIPGSGGHLNPLISMAAMFARVMPISRCVVYIISQVIGATIAGLLARLCLGEEVANTVGIGNCGIGTLDVSQAFLIEFVFCFILLYVCYGMTLDPHQGDVAGPIFGPFAISLIFCFNFVVSTLVADPSYGYGGAAMNPSRCLGPAIAMYNLDNMWIWWVAPFFAAMAHGVLYILVPPHHESLYSQMDTKRRQREQAEKERRT
jgi:glycerol uptake facilitator-like aquaporin